ncbi:glycine-rich domain-containing protein [Kitasatospora purpeofusca]|uniref:glycine-rich domain-containing protein n=1 Tax=Kitasatospora purpeofusca TaxID=67352 RepID=UPI0036ADD02E
MTELTVDPTRPPGPTAPEPGTLLSEIEWTRVVRTILGDHPELTQDTAERILAEALAYLWTVSRYRDMPLAPSPAVDAGWHALILNTAIYAGLCEKLNGFIHHYPQTPEETAYDASTVGLTVATMAACGVAADAELWAGPEGIRLGPGAQTWHSPECGPIILIPKPKPKGLPESIPA